MMIQVKDSDLQAAAGEGMDEFLNVLTDAYLAAIGGRLTAETMPLLNGDQHTLLAYRFFTDEEINRISVVAPNVVLNIIKDYEVVEKKHVVLPDTLHDIVCCANPKCITNNEPMASIFHVTDKERGIVRCHYCEKEQCLSSMKLK